MRSLCILFGLLWANVVTAQNINVQTGEHADFSRVVLQIPNNAEWQVTSTNDGYDVQVTGATGFELESFYDLIPRDRIADVAVVTPDTLRMEMTCRCRVDSFLDRPGILVIDVSDDESAVAEQLEAVDDTLSTRVEEPTSPKPVFDLITMPLATPAMSPAPALPEISELSRIANEHADLNALEERVAQSLSRAASQGLLELSTNPLPMPEVALEPDPSQSSQSNEFERLPPPFPAQTIRPGITAHTAVDSGLGEAIRSALLTAQVMECWPDHFVDVPNWGTDDPFAQQIGQYRRAMTGEFDLVDPDAVLALARLYVYFGFGREAIQTLQIDNNMSRERAAIITLAQIIDEDPLTETAILSQTQCPNQTALWSILASTDGPTLSEADATRVTRNFRLLPSTLQSQLKPRLAKRLINMDALDLAETIMSAGPQDTPALETTMVLSEIAIDRGDASVATQALNQLAETDARMTPEAVIKLIELEIEQANPIGPETLDLARSLEFENRDLPIAADLARVIVAGSLQNKQHELAWQSLSEFLDVMRDEDAKALAELIIGDATRHAKDATFLNLTFANPLEALSPESENAVAKRLMNLGFPERAMDFLGRPAIGAVMAERRYLRAESAIYMGNTQLAEAHLAGISTPRAQNILSFGPDGVSMLLLAEQDAETEIDEVTAAWRNGDWAALEQSDDALLSDISTRVLGASSPPLEEAEAPLAAGRALVADAGETREAIDELMTRFELPPLDSNP